MSETLLSLQTLPPPHKTYWCNSGVPQSFPSTAQSYPMVIISPPWLIIAWAKPCFPVPSYLTVPRDKPKVSLHCFLELELLNYCIFDHCNSSPCNPLVLIYCFRRPQSRPSLERLLLQLDSLHHYGIHQQFLILLPQQAPSIGTPQTCSP